MIAILLIILLALIVIRSLGDPASPFLRAPAPRVCPVCCFNLVAQQLAEAGDECQNCRATYGRPQFEQPRRWRSSC